MTEAEFQERQSVIKAVIEAVNNEEIEDFIFFYKKGKEHFVSANGLFNAETKQLIKNEVNNLFK